MKQMTFNRYARTLSNKALEEAIVNAQVRDTAGKVSLVGRFAHAADKELGRRAKRRANRGARQKDVRHAA